MSLRDYLFYEEPGVTLYCGDARTLLPLLSLSGWALATDPPYPNRAGHYTADVSTAEVICRAYPWREALCFWDALCHPPLPIPVVAAHVWHRTNVNGCPYEVAYECRADGVRRRSDVLTHPAIFAGAGPGCHHYAGHPTQKPVPVMRALIGKLRAVGIVDPFAGVGSTVIAAKEHGRPVIGIEIEPRYCEIAVKRLRQEVLALESA